MISIKQNVCNSRIVDLREFLVKKHTKNNYGSYKEYLEYIDNNIEHGCLTVKAKKSWNTKLHIKDEHTDTPYLWYYVYKYICECPGATKDEIIDNCRQYFKNEDDPNKTITTILDIFILPSRKRAKIVDNNKYIPINPKEWHND